MHKILLVGNDPWLLRTRALLLKRTETEVLTTDPYQFAKNAVNQQFELLVVCHSLDDAARRYVSTEAHRLWPRVRVMQVSDDYYGSNSEPYADDIVPSCNPGEFVSHARTLLEAPASSCP
jgi:hypothetical protein